MKLFSDYPAATPFKLLPAELQDLHNTCSNEVDNELTVHIKKTGGDPVIDRYDQHNINLYFKLYKDKAGQPYPHHISFN